MNYLIVGAGGFLGAITRYLVYNYEKHLNLSSFPLGTLAINTIGCFIAGVFMAGIQASTIANKDLVLFATMGFLGAFTTFSTFSVDTLTLFKNGNQTLAFTNIVLNFLLGMLAVWLGYFLYLYFQSIQK